MERGEKKEGIEPFLIVSPLIDREKLDKLLSVGCGFNIKSLQLELNGTGDDQWLLFLRVS